jgi:hypothetical protein
MMKWNNSLQEESPQGNTAKIDTLSEEIEHMLDLLDKQYSGLIDE